MMSFSWNNGTFYAMDNRMTDKKFTKKNTNPNRVKTMLKIDTTTKTAFFIQPSDEIEIVSMNFIARFECITINIIF